MASRQIRAVISSSGEQCLNVTTTGCCGTAAQARAFQRGCCGRKTQRARSLLAFCKGQRERAVKNFPGRLSIARRPPGVGSQHSFFDEAQRRSAAPGLWR
jgi:hypothetical protein